jgi:tRNA threonylcarbamoyladenosine biosynthesis protein TsaB
VPPAGRTSLAVVLLLAFDTATPAVTVALYNGTAVVAESTVVDAMRHAELLAPGIADVLEAAGASRRDLTEVAVGVGPGPFTGLRVGLVTARTLGHVLDIPVRGACTLDVLAAGADPRADARADSRADPAPGAGDPSPPRPFLVATDARRKEVYWARYADQFTRVDGPHVGLPADLATTDPVVGRGAVLYPEAFPHAAGPEHPRAADLARIVADRSVPVLDPVPLYLRRPDVAEPGARKRVLTGLSRPAGR